MTNYNFTNLVFEGGGVWGVAYLGMLKELEDRKILGQIQRVGGSSAGAITSLVTSFGLNFQEMQKIANTLDYSKIPDPDKTFLVDDALAKALNVALKRFDKQVDGDDVACIMRLLTHNGWYSSEYFYKWLQNIIADQFNHKKKKGPYTFADFQDASLHKSGKKFMDLYITGSDISNHKEVIFSAATTPDIEVATAVRISMSIPLFFESIELKLPNSAASSIFSDGGTMLNYPISIFDKKEFGGNNKTNYQTLGGHFFSSNTKTNPPINGLKGYIENLFLSLIASQNILLETSPQDQFRTINIDTFDVKPTDFQIKVDDPMYTKLFNSGNLAAKLYLDNYSPEKANLQPHTVQSLDSVTA
jgi:NTE family protein